MSDAVSITFIVCMTVVSLAMVIGTFWGKR